MASSVFIVVAIHILVFIMQYDQVAWFFFFYPEKYFTKELYHTTHELFILDDAYIHRYDTIIIYTCCIGKILLSSLDTLEVME